MSNVSMAIPESIADINSDPLSDFLSGIRADSGIARLYRGAPPWRLFVPRGDTQFYIVMRGAQSISDISCASTHLNEGEIIIFPRGRAHTLSALSECTIPRTDEFISAECSLAGAAGHPLVDALPDVIRLSGVAESLEPTVQALYTMLDGKDADRSGYNAIALKQMEVIFVHAVRAWLADPTNTGLYWYGALRCQILRRTLSQIHANPGQEWTLARIAEIAGVSRSTISKVFVTFVGTSPMDYVSKWRLSVAARLLRQERLTVQEVAERVGYGAQAAFSRVFKRRFGVSPAIYRDRFQTSFCPGRLEFSAADAITMESH